MRRAALPALALATVALSGCSGFGAADSSAGPDRDDQGAVTDAASDAAIALEVGDCLDAPDLATQVVEVPFVPCDEPHDSEAYASTELDGSEYPGEDAVIEKADAFCYLRFEGFVGTSYEESELDYFLLYPTKESWVLWHDREVRCVVHLVDSTVTGTLRGTAR